MKTIATVLALALAASLAVMGIAALEGRANRGHEIPEPPPPAREGTPLAVMILSLYSDEAGTPLFDGQGAVPVGGVRLRAEGAEGMSEAVVDERGEAWLTLLAGQSYAVTAELGDSSMSAQVTIQGYASRVRGAPGVGGTVRVMVLYEDESIVGVTWAPALFA